MKCTIPEISWHNRDPVLSVDIQPKLESDKNEFYRLVTGGTDSHVLIWHMKINETGSINLDLVADLARHQKAVNCVKWSPNGELLASSDDESVIFIWRQKGETETLNVCDTANEQDKETWATMKILRGHLDDIYDLSWSPSSTLLLSGSVDNTAVVWDVYKGKSLYALADHKGFVQGVAWDPLNQYIATLSTDRSTRLFKVNSTYCTKRSATSKTDVHLTHNNTFFSNIKSTRKIQHLRFDFSPDGKYLITPSLLNSPPTSTFHLYDIKSSLEILKPSFTTPNIRESTFVAKFCPLIFKRKHGIMKRMIYAISTETSVYIYDSTSKKPLYEYQDIHKECIKDMSWSNDGRILVISSQDGYCSFILFSEHDFEELYIGMKNRAYQDESLQIEDCIDKIQPKVRSLNLTCTENDKKFILKQNASISIQTELQENNQTTENINETYYKQHDVEDCQYYEAQKNSIFLEQSKDEDKYKSFLQPINCKQKFIFEEQEKYSKLCRNYNPSQDISKYLLNQTENQNGRITGYTVTEDEEANENISEINICDESDCDKKSVKESQKFDLIDLSTLRHQHDIIKTGTGNDQSYEPQFTDRNSDKYYRDTPSTSCQTSEYLRQQEVGQKQQILDHGNYILNQFEISKEMNRICEYSAKGKDKDNYTNFMKSLNNIHSFNPTSSNILNFIVLNQQDTIPDQTVPQVVEMTNEDINERSTPGEIVDVEGISLESPVSSNLTNLTNQNDQPMTVESETENYQSYEIQSMDRTTVGDYRNNPSTSRQSVVNEELDILNKKEQVLRILLKYFEARTQNNERYLKEKNQKKIVDNASSLNRTRAQSVIVMNPYYSIPPDQTVPQNESLNRNETIPTDNIIKSGTLNLSDHSHPVLPRVAQSVDMNPVQICRNISSSYSHGENFLMQCLREFLDQFIPKYPTGMNAEELAQIVLQQYQSSVSQFTERNSVENILQEQNQEMVKQYAAQLQIIVIKTLKSLMEEVDRERNNIAAKIRTENVVEYSHSYAPLSMDGISVEDYRNIPSTSNENVAGNSSFHGPQSRVRNLVEGTSKDTGELLEKNLLLLLAAQDQIVMDEKQQKLQEEEDQESNNNEGNIRTEIVVKYSHTHASNSTDRNSVEDYSKIPSTSKEADVLAEENVLLLLMAQDQMKQPMLEEKEEGEVEEEEEEEEEDAEDLELFNKEEKFRSENVVKYSHTHVTESMDINSDTDYEDIRDMPGSSWQTPEDLRQRYKKNQASTSHQQVSNRIVTQQPTFLDDQIYIQDLFGTSIEEQKMLVDLYDKEKHKDPYTKLRESSNKSFENFMIKLSPQVICAELNKAKSDIVNESIQNWPTDSIYTEGTHLNIDNTSTAISQNPIPPTRKISLINIGNTTRFNRKRKIFVRDDIFDSEKNTRKDSDPMIPFSDDTETKVEDAKVFDKSRYSSDSPPTSLDEEHSMCKKSKDHIQSNPIRSDNNNDNGASQKNYINPDTNNDDADNESAAPIQLPFGYEIPCSDQLPSTPPSSSSSSSSSSPISNSHKRKLKSKKKNLSKCKPQKDFRDDKDSEPDSDSNSKSINYRHGSEIKRRASSSANNGENIGPSSSKCKKLDNNSQSNNDNDEDFNKDQNETMLNVFGYYSEPFNNSTRNKEYLKYLLKNFFVSNKQFSRKSFNLFPSKDHKNTKSYLDSDNDTKNIVNIFNDDKTDKESKEKFTGDQIVPVVSSNQNEDKDDRDENVIFCGDNLIMNFVRIDHNVERFMENDKDVAHLSDNSFELNEYNNTLRENLTSENDPTIIYLGENRNDSIECKLNEFVMELNCHTPTINMEDTNQQHINGSSNSDKKQDKDNDSCENTDNKEISSGNPKKSSSGNCAGSNADDDKDRNSNTDSNDVEEENDSSEDNPIKEKSINTYDVTYTYTFERFFERWTRILHNPSIYIASVKELPGILHIGRIYRNRSGQVVRIDSSHYHSETGVIVEDVLDRNRKDNIILTLTTDIVTKLQESFRHTVSNVEIENAENLQQEQFYSEVEYENSRVFRIENSNNIQNYEITEGPGTFTIITTFSNQNNIPIGTINTTFDSMPSSNASIPSDILMLCNRFSGLTLPTTINLITNERTQRIPLVDVDPLNPLNASECNDCSIKHFHLLRDRVVEEDTDLQYLKRKIIIGHLSKLLASNDGYFNIWIFIIYFYQFFIIYNLFCEIFCILLELIILYRLTNSLNVQNYNNNRQCSSEEIQRKEYDENEPNEKLFQNNLKCEPDDVLLSINENVEEENRPNEKINNKSDSNESFPDDSLDNTGTSSNKEK